MTLAPRNYSDLAGRTMRLAMCFVPHNLGAFDSQDTKQAIMLLAKLCNENRVHRPTKRNPYRMKNATRKDYAEALDRLIVAVRDWRKNVGLP